MKIIFQANNGDYEQHLNAVRELSKWGKNYFFKFEDFLESRKRIILDI